MRAILLLTILMTLSSDLWLICAGSVSKVLSSGLTIGSCVDVLALRWLAKSTKMSNCGKPFLVVPLEKRPFFFELLLFLLVEVAARHQNRQTAANSQTTRQYFGNRSSTYQPQIGRKSHAQDIRYYCGAVEHWSLNCPEKTERMTTSAK
jgi:hypothetical protein